MPRLQVHLRTNLSFYAPSDGSGLDEAATPFAAITFDGREFVWHGRRFSSTEVDPPIKYGPTLVTAIADYETALVEAASAAHRLLSALAFEHVCVVDVWDPPGWSETHDLTEAPSGGVPQSVPGGIGAYGVPTAVHVEADPTLRLALGTFREGLNAATPFHALISFWNALDVAFGEASERDAFIDDRWGAEYKEWRAGFTEQWGHQWIPPEDAIAGYFRNDVRNAVVHPQRERPEQAHLNPDVPADRYRVQAEAWWLRSLAREAIRERWPTGLHIATRE